MSRHEKNSPPTARLPNLGQVELEVLTFVQAHAPATVRQVADHLAATRGVVRTTALNIMSRLWRKGYLSRKQAAGVYQYEPRIARGKLLRGLVSDFVSDALGGSVSPFVAYLCEEVGHGGGGVSDEELARLQKLVRDLEQRKGGS